MEETPSSSKQPCARDTRFLSAVPELPTEKAFVLHLSRDTGPRLEPFTGRVEHLTTGRRLRFATFEEFVAVLTRLLNAGVRE